MRLQDIMTTDVKTIFPFESAHFAWEKMQFEQIHHLVVVDKEQAVVGIVSDRDLGGNQGKQHRQHKKVEDLMTSNPLTGDPRMTVKEAANAFRGFSIGSIPVVEDGKLVGIVTITDLLELIGRGLERDAVKKERRPESGLPIYRREGTPRVS